MSNLQVYGNHLEQRAELLRERLLSTLDELDRRRHALVSLRVQAREHPAALVLVAAVSIAGMGGAVVLAVRRARTRRARLRSRRLLALQRLWSHPERVAPEERGVLRSIGMRVLVAIGTGAAMWVLRRGGRFAWELSAGVSSAHDPVDLPPDV
jgi:hypothetical protein